MSAEITKVGCFDLQVCVPADWTDEQVKDFAESEYPCGTENGWFIRRKGDEALAGDPERISCQDEDRKGYVHIMLDA